MANRREFLYCIVLLGALAVTETVAGKDKTSSYENGKLIDLQRYGTGFGALRAQGSFCFAVQVGDLTYLARHEAYWRGSYEPTDFVVGDPVEVKVKGNDLYLKKPKGGELKTAITRRERSVPGKPPTDCSLAVSVRN